MPELCSNRSLEGDADARINFAIMRVTLLHGLPSNWRNCTGAGYFTVK
jgi:hypothetical protein